MAAVFVTDQDDFATATTPAPIDPANANSVLTEVVQPLANRTRFIYERSGVATAPTLAALAAMPGALVDGQVRRVPRYGCYVFETASAGLVDAPPLVLARTAGPGFWVHENFASRSSRRISTPPSAMHRWSLSEPTGNFANAVRTGQDLAPSNPPPRRRARGVLGRGIEYAFVNLGIAGGAMGPCDPVVGHALTVSAWVIFDSVSLRTAPIVARAHNGGNTAAWRLEVNALGQLRIGAKPVGKPEVSADAKSVLPIGVPLHIALVLGLDSGVLFGGGGLGFVNGVAQCTVPWSALDRIDDTGAATHLAIGGGDFTYNSYAPSGVLEDVLIETVAVDQDELRARYLRGIGLFEEP